jgi:hypothetical protein
VADARHSEHEIRGGAWWTRPWPLHPVLLAAYPVLFLFSENISEQLSLEPMFPPLAAAMAGTLAVLAILRLLLRDWLRAALVTSVLVGLFFSYGHVRSAADGLIEGGIRQRYLLPAWGVLLLVGGLVAWRIRPGALRTTTTVLNVAAAFLVLVNLVPIVGFQLNGIAAPVAAQREPVASGADVSRRPDIYYIIFDRYSSAETIRRVYGFDNTPFLEELERRGFYVASDSNANYLKTSLSLASSLSMEYLDMEALRAEADARDDLRPIYRRLANAQAVQTSLKALGYTYIHLGSPYQMTATNAAADLNVRYSEESEFATVLAETSLLSAASILFPEQEIDPEYARWRFHMYQFEQLERVTAQPGPKFVFAHFAVPHPPFLIDRDGNLVRQAERRERGWERGFVEMVQYANERILAFVDILQAGPEETHPVIILQADEGQYPLELSQASSPGRWDEATPDELREKYGILNAYYLPGIDDAGLYPSISPVNSFRVVFNHYFNAGLERLPDRSYAPFEADYNYEVFEITDILRGEDPSANRPAGFSAPARGAARERYGP